MKRIPLLLLTGLILTCNHELPTSPVLRTGNDAVRSKRQAVGRIGSVTPACSAPAPFFAAPACRIPGYIVAYQPDFDPVATTAKLQQKYGFAVKYVYQYALHGFSADALSLQTVAALRCEPAVRYVEENAMGSVVDGAESCP